MTREDWLAHASANLAEARKKNGRLGIRKSRSGCTTCKTRRVKCDERRPACERCTSTGRECGGYKTPTSQSPPELLIAPVPDQLTHPSLRLGENRSRSFDFFLKCTAPVLGGSLDRDFWCGDVLQLAQTEPLILDTLLAISTLYEHPQYLKSFTGVSMQRPIDEMAKALAPDPRKPITMPILGRRHVEALEKHQISASQNGALVLDEHHAQALRHYNKAIARLRVQLESGQATPLLALLSCVLFICVEVLRDHVFGALELFQRGSEMLTRFSSSLSGQEHSVFQAITLMLARLGVLGAAFGYPYPIVFPRGVEQTKVFANMTEARSALWVIMADSHTFTGDASAYNDALRGHHSNQEASVSAFGELTAENSMTASPVTINILTGVDGISYDCACHDPPVMTYPAMLRRHPEGASISMHSLEYVQKSMYAGLLERQAQLELRLSQWHDAFDRAAATTDDAETTSHLYMYYHVNFIWQRTRIGLSLMIFDEYRYHFEQILHHAAVYVKAKSLDQPVFTFEVGAVPPLYLVATTCRVPSLRRKALQLLAQAPRKECK